MQQKLLLFLCVFWTVKFNAQQSIIATTDTKVFYCDLPNPISVILNGVDPSRLVVKGVNCNVTGKNGNYNATVSSGTNRLCWVKAGTVRQKGDTAWIKEEEFKIRPRPTVNVTVNGKEGGSVTNAEVKVWNFMNASFGPQFSKDGYQMSVANFNMTCQTRSREITLHSSSPAISDAIKNLVTSLEDGDYVMFHDINIVNNFNRDTIKVAAGPSFKLQYSAISSTIHNFGVSNGSNKDKGVYSYSGNMVGGKKDGLWFTTLSGYSDIKVGESYFHLDTLLSEKHFYFGADIMTEIKYNWHDTLAFITAYYMNGNECYKGNYKIDMTHSAFMNDEGEDRVYYDTSAMRSRDRYELYRDVPLRALTGVWQFFYENGKPAAKGQFNSKLQYTSLYSHDAADWHQIVTRDGKWKYYRMNGKLYHEVKYENGFKMTETFFVE